MNIAIAVLLIFCVIVTIIAIRAFTPDKTRADLEARYPANTMIDAAGMRLRVRDTGPRDAAAIIMLHGFGSSLETWEPWAGLLDATHRVIRFDLPGFALTGSDPTGNYSDARSLQVLAGLMDALAIGRATLIGNSLGGKIAWLFAAEHPERVMKLVLVSPDGFAPPGYEYNKPAKIPGIAKLLPYLLPMGLVRGSLKPAYADPAALTPATLARYRDLLLAPGVRRAMVARMSQMRLRPPEPILHRIQAPTLLLWGEEDGMIPIAMADSYMKWIPDCRLVTLRKLGHVPMEEEPETALAPVLDFLAEPPGKPGRTAIP